MTELQRVKLADRRGPVIDEAAGRLDGQNRCQQEPRKLAEAARVLR